MKKLAIASAVLSILAISSVANAYQAEVGVDYTRVSPDGGSNGNGFGVNGKYYFNDVQTRDYPLAEAGFMNRASNVDASYQYNRADGNSTNTYGVGIEYFVPNSDFYTSASFDKSDNDNSRNNTKRATAEIGYLPAPNLLLAVGAIYQKNDGSSDTDPSIRAKYVTKIGAHDVNFEGGAAFGDTDVFNLGADYYLDKTWSIGAGFEKTSFDQGSDNDVWNIRTRKFINSQVSLEANAAFGDYGDTYGLGAKYRF